MMDEKKHAWVKFYVSAPASIVAKLLTNKEDIRAQFNKIRFPGDQLPETQKYFF